MRNSTHLLVGEGHRNGDKFQKYDEFWESGTFNGSPEEIMQLVQRTGRTTRGRKALRSAVSAAAATLLLAGWTSAAKADVTFASAQFIPSSSFTTPPPATVFGDLPTATVTGGGSQGVYTNFFSFNAMQGQTVRLDIDNASNPNSDYTNLALFSGNGALLAFNQPYRNSVAPDPGSTLTYDGYLVSNVNKDAFIGDYTLTYPNSNLYGTPINSQADPKRNTYYVAVSAGGRFGTTPFFSASGQNATFSALTRPDGLNGGTAVNYSSLGYDVNANFGGTGTPSFSNSSSSLTPYTLNISLSPAATAPVPEPGTMALMGLGIAGLAASRRRKKNKSDVSAAIA